MLTDYADKPTPGSRQSVLLEGGAHSPSTDKELRLGVWALSSSAHSYCLSLVPS